MFIRSLKIRIHDMSYWLTCDDGLDLGLLKFDDGLTDWLFISVLILYLYVLSFNVLVSANRLEFGACVKEKNIKVISKLSELIK